MKTFTISIDLIMEYDARDKFDDYANSILQALEQGTTSLESAGYYHTRIELVDAGEEFLQEKHVVRGVFELSLMGSVNR